MFGFLTVAILLVAYAGAQEDDALSPNDKSECIREFMQWCDDRKYPQEGSGMSILSLTYRDKEGYYRVFCSSDSEGTNCTKNGSPWFACKPEADRHTLSYKGQVLSDAEADVDDDICNTMNKATKEMFVQNFAFDNATLTKIHQELGSFFQEIAAMQAEIYELQKRLTGGSFMDGFLRGFGGGGLFGRRPDTAAEDDSDSVSNSDNDSDNDSDQNTSKESNQIERE